MEIYHIFLYRYIAYKKKVSFKLFSYQISEQKLDVTIFILFHFFTQILSIGYKRSKV